MMRLFVLGLCLLLAIPLFSQVTPAEQKKLEEDLKKAEAEFKKALEQSKDLQKSIMSQSVEPGEFKAPKKRTDLLATIPKTNFTAATLVQYVKGLMLKLESLPVNKAAIAYVKQKHTYKTGEEYNRAAFVLWYSGRKREGVYAALKAASLSPNNVMVLSNLCAFLNMSGYPHKAIPILKYGLTKQQKNVHLLNNIGQAYYQLGDLPASTTYLSTCTSIDQYNIEANNTRGHIESANGNTQAATEFYENSLKGGYNQSAADRLGKLGNPVEDIIRLPKPRSYPETDDNIGFECPSYPGGAEIPAFNARMQGEAEAWSRLAEEYKERAHAAMLQNGMDIKNIIQSGNRPNIQLGIMHQKASLAMAKSLLDYLDRAKRLDEEFAEWKDEWNINLNRRLSEACANALPDQCCQLEAAVWAAEEVSLKQRYTQYCNETWTNARGHYNVVAFWQPIFSPSRGIVERDLIQARYILLTTASKLSAGITIHDPTCGEPLPPSDLTKDANFKFPDCKVSIKIPLIIAEIELGCDKISIGGGEIIMIDAEYDFNSGQSTIAVGIGAGVEAGIGEVGVKAQYYFTFDGNGELTDAGLKYSSKAEMAGAELGPLDFGSIGVESTLTVDFMGADSGVRSSIEASAYNNELFKAETQLYSSKN